MQLRTLVRRRRPGWLTVTLFVLAAVGVSLGFVQGGSPAQGSTTTAAAAGLGSTRVTSSVTAGTVIAPAEACAALTQADFSAIPGASTTIVSADPTAVPTAATA